MRAQLITFIAERYGWDNKEMEQAESFEDLGLDSLSLYSLVSDVEEEFSVEISTDDMTEIDSPIKFVDYVVGCVRNES